MAEYVDKDLLEDLSNGKERAFSEIFNRYFNRLFLSCAGIVHTTQDGQDVAITTLNKLFERKQRFDRISAMENWLFLAARNSCIDVLRRRESSIRRHEATAELDMINDELDHDLLKMTLHLVDRLPKQSRQVIILRYLHGKKYKEIGQAMNISPRTVENLLRSALDRLRTGLQDKRVVLLLPIGLSVLDRLMLFGLAVTLILSFH